MNDVENSLGLHISLLQPPGFCKGHNKTQHLDHIPNVAIVPDASNRPQVLILSLIWIEGSATSLEAYGT